MITKNEILIKLKELKPDLYKDYSVKEIGLFVLFLMTHLLMLVTLTSWSNLKNQLAGNAFH